MLSVFTRVEIGATSFADGDTLDRDLSRLPYPVGTKCCSGVAVELMNWKFCTIGCVLYLRHCQPLAPCVITDQGIDSVYIEWMVDAL